MNAAQELAAVRTRSAGFLDRDGVAGLLQAMDRQGLYQRHFGHGEGHNLALLARFEQLGQERRAMVVAQTADGSIVGHGEYAGDGEGVEFALLVQPEWRHRGIARAMLERLCRRASAACESEIHGLVKADNTAMLNLARATGFALATSGEAGVMRISRRLAPSPRRRCWFRHR